MPAMQRFPFKRRGAQPFESVSNCLRRPSNAKLEEIEGVLCRELTDNLNPHALPILGQSIPGHAVGLEGGTNLHVPVLRTATNR